MRRPPSLKQRRCARLIQLCDYVGTAAQMLAAGRCLATLQPATCGPRREPRAESWGIAAGPRSAAARVWLWSGSLRAKLAIVRVAARRSPRFIWSANLLPARLLGRSIYLLPRRGHYNYESGSLSLSLAGKSALLYY